MTMKIAVLFVVLLGTAFAAPNVDIELRELLEILLARGQGDDCLNTGLLDLLDISDKPELQCPKLNPETDNIAALNSKSMKNGFTKLLNGEITINALPLEDVQGLSDNQPTEEFIEDFIDNIDQAFTDKTKDGTDGLTGMDAADVMEATYRRYFNVMYQKVTGFLLPQFKALRLATLAGIDGGDEPGCLDQDYDDAMKEACIVKKTNLLREAFQMWEDKFAIHECITIDIPSLDEYASFSAIETKVRIFNQCMRTELGDILSELNEDFTGKPLAKLLAMTAQNQRLTSIPLTIASQWGLFMHNCNRKPWLPKESKRGVMFQLDELYD